MTSISSSFAAHSFSPLSRLQSELSSEVSSGAISASDKDALSAALTDIDSALKGQMHSAGGGQRPSPTDMQSKINDLIDGEVSNGKLTSAQAGELKQVFANALQVGPGGAAGPTPDGPPGGMLGLGSFSDNSTTNSTSTEGSDLSQLLQEFLKNIQDSFGASTNYGTDGRNLAAQIESLVVNYQA